MPTSVPGGACGPLAEQPRASGGAPPPPARDICGQAVGAGARDGGARGGRGVCAAEGLQRPAAVSAPLPVVGAAGAAAGTRSLRAASRDERAGAPPLQAGGPLPVPAAAVAAAAAGATAAAAAAAEAAAGVRAAAAPSRTPGAADATVVRHLATLEVVRATFLRYTGSPCGEWSSEGVSGSGDARRLVESRAVPGSPHRVFRATWLVPHAVMDVAVVLDTPVRMLWDPQYHPSCRQVALLMVVSSKGHPGSAASIVRAPPPPPPRHIGMIHPN